MRDADKALKVLHIHSSLFTPIRKFHMSIQ